MHSRIKTVILAAGLCDFVWLSSYSSQAVCLCAKFFIFLHGHAVNPKHPTFSYVTGQKAAIGLTHNG